ncbi:MAG: hypothetical protein CVV50_03245 [Spirochaetae bacterium HGW-Spirochaetae-6]|nr:MAG: hypothetical protein CVV50_03245 [Spirochaetae bacterium HGW-Spirochaetae-6]
MVEAEKILQETNVFSEMMKYFEEATSDFLQKMTQDERYMKAISRFRDSMLDVKSYFDKIVTQSLKNLNLPTKEEIERALYKMTLLEAKMNEVSTKLDQLLKK